MQLHKLALMVFCTVIAVGSVTPAFAYDDWREHERNEWRERAWRQREWREHEWREHEWRERSYAPPAVIVRPYGFAPPPPINYNNQWPFR